MSFCTKDERKIKNQKAKIKNKSTRRGALPLLKPGTLLRVLFLIFAF
jgi:hypothetical protein